MAKRAIERPLEQKALDPACGSGTFLFHAIRLCLAEAEESGTPREMRASDAAELVAGIDIHPVAVIIARVTCLLALSPVLAARRGTLKIPVYLGDAMQLAVSQHFADTTLSIRVPQANGEPATSLDFPEVLCRDPDLFDGTVEMMRRGSESGLTRVQFETRIDAGIRQRYADLARRFPNPIFRRFGEEEARAVTDIGATYLVYDRLRREGRDTIWPYVARNLSRPLSLSAGAGWANVVIGNPPWVALRHMSDDLQKRFKELAKGLGVYVGGKFATQNDLSALFTARAAALYLRGSGRLAFVLPLAALSRGQFERLRSGAFHGGAIQWEEAWTMDDSVQPLFPVPSCAVFGRRRATSKPMPERVRAYSGSLPMRDAPEALVDRRIAEGKFRVEENAEKPTEGKFSGGSEYRQAFRQGATLVPRMLCFVERKALGRLGSDLAAPLVASRRSTQEKQPWKNLPGIENQVEAQFLRATLLGESILPFRIFRPFEAVIPVTENGEVLDSRRALDRQFDGLADWMRKAEAVWDQNNDTGMSLVEQFDYYGKLRAQYPIPPTRVVYAKAGTQPTACLLLGSQMPVDHMLYWCTPGSLSEARYLCGILNSETARSRAASYQARGQWGARHFDKVIFNLPIPRFDAKFELHRDLAEAGVSETIDKLVERLLDGE